MAEVFNLGNVFGQAEAIQAARNRNVLAGINLQAAKRKERNLNMIRQARKQFDNGGEVVKQLREAGENDAADMFVRTQVAGKLNEINLIKSIAPMITDASSYERLRGELIQEGAIEEDTLPVEFNQSVFKNLNRKANLELSKFRLAVEKFGFDKSKFAQIENREREKLGLERRKVATGERRERRLGDEGLNTSVSRLVYQQVAAAYGGRYDPKTGEISRLDKTKVAKVARVSAQAERYAAQGIDPNQAVQRALTDEGVGAGPKDDPDYIREAYRAYPD